MSQSDWDSSASRNEARGLACEARHQAWWHVMGYEAGPPRLLETVELQFRRLASLAHPDRGGDAEQMQRLIRARAQARRQLTA